MKPIKNICAELCLILADIVKHEETEMDEDRKSSLQNAADYVETAIDELQREGG